MMNKHIKWEKFTNPLLPVLAEGEEEAGRVMVRSTPFGVEGLKFNPNFPSEKVYIAHTNFDIDAGVKASVENTDGVEIVEVYSPYRMRITIGKAFNGKKVRYIITKKLCEVNSYNFTDKVNISLYKETINLKSQNKPWSIFVLPNGSYESKSFSTEGEMMDTVNQWQLIKSKIGGLILTS